MSVSRVEPSDAHAIQEALGQAQSVLVLAPDAAESICTTLLSLMSPADAHLLMVTLSRAPDAWLDDLRIALDGLPSETGVIAVGESTRSAAAASTSSTVSTPVSVDTVTDPSDLTGLAMAVGAYLDAWSVSEATPVVCFDSITDLLFHAEEARVFRFLHSTTGRLRDVGAFAHYHLNPAAYDDSTVNAFSALFDAVVRVEDDGTVSVSKRR